MDERTRKSIIVAADDYGIRESSRPILELARAGKLDRVGVLVHFVSPDEARDLLETGVKLDIHLELIEFLNSGREARGGVFGRGLNFIWRTTIGRQAAREARVQWQQQIDRFQELFGRLPDGLNSHEHIHYFPVFFKAFLELAEKHRIGYVRFGSRGIFHGGERRLVSGILDFFFRRNSRAFEASGLHSSDYLTSFDWISDFAAFLREPFDGTIELVVHPEREEEYHVLKDSF